MSEATRFWIITTAAGLLLAVAVIVLALAVAQRCAVEHEKGSPEWHTCVEDLAR